MITGTVNARYEMIIRLPVRDSAGQEQDVETVLDTGFTGSLTLTPSMIASLGLSWRSCASVILADGRVEQFDIYAATIVWDGMPRSILLQAIDTDPLLGMELLVDYDLRARVRAGGIVQIEAVP